MDYDYDNDTLDNDTLDTFAYDSTLAGYTTSYSFASSSNSGSSNSYSNGSSSKRRPSPGPSSAAQGESSSLQARFELLELALATFADDDPNQPKKKQVVSLRRDLVTSQPETQSTASNDRCLALGLADGISIKGASF